jgi:hypothetical protein
MQFARVLAFFVSFHLKPDEVPYLVSLFHHGTGKHNKVGGGGVLIGNQT